MSHNNYQEFRYPKALLPVLMIPIVCFVVVLGLNWGLGCSEHTEYQSESCRAAGDYFGIDVYQFLLLPYLLSFYASVVALPIGIVLVVIKGLVNSHRRRQASAN